jgi:hypothetical protein
MSRQQVSQIQSSPIALCFDLNLGTAQGLEGSEKMHLETLHKDNPKAPASGAVEDDVKVEELKLFYPEHGLPQVPYVPDGSECNTVAAITLRVSDAEEVIDLVKERRLRRKLDVTYVYFLMIMM